ncbi:DUF423 domain-containing protein [Neobacillus massiliamazoniensis]|jgi:uncharacterized membrane protein YgdD (TMEM256/DUF423 family)|uniref:DUF423 domain-containing protein n=1 Tax=Neobacillus massiliamazoniensis TaxID=1499688 RepID=A0A0U1NX23_9BACI|nr:DUF423 domain-containing protein [Neobacillus massiliamazoniensis]CRK82581.1 Hypothetical protein BN000_02514 [Neobacillus massiliamazoniensis]
MKTFIIIGAINAFLAVALGAFGAHGLANKLEPKYLEIWKTGVNYQMFHALGMLAVATILGQYAACSIFRWSGWLMLIGVILFSGSLYVLSLTKISIIGAITPIGGVCFLAAWLLLVIGAVKNM